MSDIVAVMDVRAHKAQINAIQDILRQVMMDGKHYGKIPGCGDKPVLLKPGAEKIMATFGIRPEVEVEEISEGEHRRFRVKVRALSNSGSFLGEGIGEASTAEDKYAWEKAASDEHYNETPEMDRRAKWRRGRNPYQEKQVRTNPADKANTVLKMAKKRALVDMVLTVTAASDIFEQDLDEEHLRPGDMTEQPKPISQPQRKAPAAKEPVGEQLTKQGTVTDVTQKSGTSAKGEWTKYFVHIDGAEKYATFDRELAQVAKDNHNGWVSIIYTTGKFGNDIVDLQPIDPPELQCATGGEGVNAANA